MWRFKIQENTIYDPESESNIILHDDHAFLAMKKAGLLAAKVLDYITDFIKEVLQLEFPQVDFVVYDTSEGEINKIIVKQLN